MEAVIAALVTGIMSVIGIVITVSASGRKQRIERQEDLAQQNAEIRADLRQHQAVTEAKIDALKEEVARHNGVVERTFRLEEQNKTLFAKCGELQKGLQDTSATASHANERANAAHNRLDRAGIMGGQS